jgi:hypothetical protein
MAARTNTRVIQLPTMIAPTVMNSFIGSNPFALVISIGVITAKNEDINSNIPIRPGTSALRIIGMGMLAASIVSRGCFRSIVIEFPLQNMLAMYPE